MMYKEIKTADLSLKIYARIDDDGIVRVTCSEENPEFQQWVADGNTPLPADE